MPRIAKHTTTVRKGKVTQGGEKYNEVRKISPLKTFSDNTLNIIFRNFLVLFISSLLGALADKLQPKI